MTELHKISDVIPFQKPQDSIFSKLLTRKISRVFTFYLVRWWPGVTPTKVSVAALVLALVASALFVAGDYWWRFGGVVLLQLSFALDCSDGEIARLKNLSSAFGAWFDSAADRFKEIAMLGAMTWYWFRFEHGSARTLVVGFGAIIGLLLVSYLREAKKSSWPATRSAEFFISKNIYIGTVDVTVYLVSAAVLLNLQFYALVIFLAVSIPLILKQLRSAYRLSHQKF